MKRLKSRFEDFKAFAIKGNVIDLAVGVIVGGAFGKIVTSLVNDVLMPLIGLIAGRVNLATLKVILRPDDSATELVEELVLRYGAFLQSIVDFLIIAVCIYVFVKIIGRFRRRQEKEAEAAAAVPTKSEELLTEIRDLLRDRKD